jgi:hypothetical protein
MKNIIEMFYNLNKLLYHKFRCTFITKCLNRYCTVCSGKKRRPNIMSVKWEDTKEYYASYLHEQYMFLKDRDNMCKKMTN